MIERAQRELISQVHCDGGAALGKTISHIAQQMKNRGTKLLTVCKQVPSML